MEYSFATVEAEASSKDLLWTVWACDLSSSCWLHAWFLWCVLYVCNILLLCDDVIQQVPVSRTGMHTGCLKLVFHPEDSVGDNKFNFSTQAQESFGINFVYPIFSWWLTSIWNSPAPLKHCNPQGWKERFGKGFHKRCPWLRHPHQELECEHWGSWHGFDPAVMCKVSSGTCWF